MTGVLRWLVLGALLLTGSPRLLAASSAEARAFDAAYKAFSDTLWERAETEFGQFAKSYTNSARLGEAILYQARARLGLSNYAGALELLSRQNAAGTRADEYLFWEGETLYQKGDLRAAVKAFGRLVRDFPASSRRLE